MTRPLLSYVIFTSVVNKGVALSSYNSLMVFVKKTAVERLPSVPPTSKVSNKFICGDSNELLSVALNFLIS